MLRLRLYRKSFVDLKTQVIVLNCQIVVKFLEINCGHPGQLWNGWLENISSGTGLGASIIFRCQDGMKMEGNGSAICQSDGTWSHPLPQCLGN